MQAETLGRYRIVRELGRGAMGRVYLAHDPQIDRHVALKTIQIFDSLPDQEQSDARERFKREARAAGRLLHPGIVTLFDVGEHQGVPYLAMEYIEGEPLDTFCDPGRLLPRETAIELVAGIAEALGYAHSHEIVHRDIKPANIMRVGETAAKVMDFGLAKNPATQLTSDGTLLGTPSYMSPEQIRGEPVDGRSDLFSLACVLYELLSGEKAFGGDSISSVVYRIVHEEPDGVASLQDGLPADLCEFLTRALEKEPDDRFEDGEKFAAALRRAWSGETAGAASGPSSSETVRTPARTGAAASAAPRRKKSVAVEVPDAAPPTVRKARRSGGVLFGAAAIVIALAAAGGYYYIEYVQKPSASVAGAGAPDPVAPPPKPGPKLPGPGGRMLFATVRTEPDGLRVTMDGEPLTSERIEFAMNGPYGVLQATQECRLVTHEVGPGDAGREIVLVPDPLEVNVVADPGVPGARVRLNGTDVGKAPASMTLDLCEDNVIRVDAARYRPGQVRINSGSSPVEARTALASLEMEPIPIGTLTLPKSRLPLKYYVDGKPLQGRPKSLELEEGHHELRVVSESHWVDITVPFRIRGDETATALPNLPPMAEFSVQSFPPNCKVSLRRENQEWRFVDNTPMDHEVAAGRYEIRIERPQTGETRQQELVLGAGPNPPVRISFGGSR